MSQTRKYEEAVNAPQGLNYTTTLEFSPYRAVFFGDDYPPVPLRSPTVTHVLPLRGIHSLFVFVSDIFLICPCQS